MVLGYICNEHGYQSECDVNESGQRTCYECGNAVTGLAGHARDRRRSPPEGEAGYTEGSIRWAATGRGVDVRVGAHGFEDAIRAAIDNLADDREPQSISEIMPVVERYRRY